MFKNKSRNDKNDKFLYLDNLDPDGGDVNINILEAIKANLRNLMFTYKIAEQQVEMLELLPETEDLASKLAEEISVKCSSEVNNERIKIIVFGTLPTIYVKTSNEAAGYLIERWRTAINKEIRSLNLPSVNQIFVYIKMYFPVNIKDFDIDNKYFKPIFDGISRSGIVADDCIKYIKAFGVEVIQEEKTPRTEVYIYNSDMGKTISNLID